MDGEELFLLEHLGREARRGFSAAESITKYADGLKNMV